LLIRALKRRLGEGASPEGLIAAAFKKRPCSPRSSEPPGSSLQRPTLLRLPGILFRRLPSRANRRNVLKLVSCDGKDFLE
jgi:hypothetical protein